MQQTTIFDPQTTSDILAELSRRGWDQLGTRRDGLATLHILRRGGVVRELEEEALAGFLASGAPDRDAVNGAHVWEALNRLIGPQSRADLRRALEDYDTTGLAGVLRQMEEACEIERTTDGRYTLPEPEL